MVMVICSICFEKYSDHYKVIDKKMSLYQCNMCSERQKFKQSIRNSKLSIKDKHDLIEYKSRIDLVNKQTMHLLNKLQNKIENIYSL